MKNFGLQAYKLATDLWSFNRSLAGKENLKTLKILKKINPLLKIKKVKSGTKVQSWKIPNEWNVDDAYIIDKSTKKKIVDFKRNNLHLMSYSISVQKDLNLKQLEKKLYYIKKYPNYIPYRTSYYKKDWGFNISYNQKKKLNFKSKYFVKIDSKFVKGSMHYAELYIKGRSKKEYIFSTYICHPSMANNELSGPCFSIYLSKWINSLKNLNYSYRFIFIPETIGSIFYIYKNLKQIKKNTLGVFNLTCLGIKNKTSLLKTKYQNTFLDDLVIDILKKNKIKFKEYDWKSRGSDERQFMSPNIEIPTISLMSEKYHEYKQYHTSADDLKLISRKGFDEKFYIYKKIIKEIDNQIFPISKNLCEPNLGKLGLYPYSNKKNQGKLKKLSKQLLTFISYCDGKNTINKIAKIMNINLKKGFFYFQILKKKKIL